MYEMIRGQIEHEDSLINHRVTWLLAANAFLLAEYGLIHVMGLAREYLDRYEVVTPGVANGQVVLHQSISPDAVHLLELAICFIGFCTTFNIACSLLGAFDSLRDLQKKWGDCVGQDYGAEQRISADNAYRTLVGNRDWDLWRSASTVDAGMVGARPLCCIAKSTNFTGISDIMDTAGTDTSRYRSVRSTRCRMGDDTDSAS